MKTAIIIGASSGIGRSLAIKLIQSGYRVGLTARRTDPLQTLAEENPEKVFYAGMNVQETSSVVPVLEALKRMLGTVDLIVISAGIGELNPSLDFQLEKEMIDTNVLGFTAVADWSFNQFLQQGHGTLAAITSIAGLRGNADSPAYSATKAYQVNYLEGLRHKAHRAGTRIRVIDIRPGFVDTKMAKSDRVFWVAPVDKAASQILAGISNHQDVVYITRRWRFIGWVVKALPGWIHKRI